MNEMLAGFGVGVALGVAIALAVTREHNVDAYEAGKTAGRAHERLALNYEQTTGKTWRN